MTSARDALEALRAGNARFVAGTHSHGTLVNESRRSELLHGQAPHAVIIGCSDSRVPIEHIFDAGFGELFVIRVAGNIITPEVLGSAEYAASFLGTRLIVVLGHSSCGAVSATFESLKGAEPEIPRNLFSILHGIAPVLQSMLTSNANATLKDAVRANTCASVEQLQTESEALEQLSQHEDLFMMGAEYDLKTGVVELFHNKPLPE